MSYEVHWAELALRLALTLLGGGLLGMERSKSGHFAGLRTTLLVTLAASVSMLQVNLLLPTNGKPADSFAVLDLMRLPLGILTGVGFIGAGAIVRRNDMVAGVTTAATLWFATVVGLCMGGGQLALGIVSTALGYFVLRGLRWFEARIEHYQSAELRLTLAEDTLSASALRDQLVRAQFRIKSLSVVHEAGLHQRTFACDVRWPAPRGNDELPPVLAELERLPGLIRLEWKSAASVPS